MQPCCYLKRVINKSAQRRNRARVKLFVAGKWFGRLTGFKQDIIHPRYTPVLYHGLWFSMDYIYPIILNICFFIN